jgi:hypothetical protein
MSGHLLEMEKLGSGCSLLDRLIVLLGKDVFFVPCEWGTKRPLVTYVERPFESTKTEAYRAIFSVQEVNVAVYLGNASGGLRAIDFDRDEDLAAFLKVGNRSARGHSCQYVSI